MCQDPVLTSQFHSPSWSGQAKLWWVQEKVNKRLHSHSSIHPFPLSFFFQPLWSESLEQVCCNKFQGCIASISVRMCFGLCKEWTNTLAFCLNTSFIPGQGLLLEVLSIRIIIRLQMYINGYDCHTHHKLIALKIKRMTARKAQINSDHNHKNC